MSQVLSAPGRMSGAQTIVAAYALFAGLSVAVNLGVQAIAVTVVPWAPLPFAMACGTGAGLVAKYVLDKCFVFQDRSTGLRDEARKIALYGVFGLFTTALFWGTEAGLFALVGTGAARNAGAVLGLVFGYGLKFSLDRRYTFAGPPAAGSAPRAAVDQAAARSASGLIPSRRQIA